MWVAVGNLIQIPLDRYDRVEKVNEESCRIYFIGGEVILVPLSNHLVAQEMKNHQKAYQARKLLQYLEQKKHEETIETVMNHSGKNRTDVERVLISCNGDAVEAILKLMDSE